MCLGFWVCRQSLAGYLRLGGLIPVFQEFFASIYKFFILAGGTGHCRQLVRQIVHNMFISNNRASFHLW